MDDLCARIQRHIDEADEALLQMNDDESSELCKEFHETVADVVFRDFLQRGGALKTLRSAVKKVTKQGESFLPLPPLPLPEEQLTLRPPDPATATVVPAAGEAEGSFEWRFLELGSGTADVCSVIVLAARDVSQWHGFRHLFSFNELWRFFLRVVVLKKFSWRDLAAASGVGIWSSSRFQVACSLSGTSPVESMNCRLRCSDERATRARMRPRRMVLCHA